MDFPGPVFGCSEEWQLVIFMCLNL